MFYMRRFFFFGLVYNKVSKWAIIRCLTLYIIGYFRSRHHFLFLGNIEKKSRKVEAVLNNFEILRKMEDLLQRSKCFIFYNFLKYMIFQRRQKAFLY